MKFSYSGTKHHQHGSLRQPQLSPAPLIHPPKWMFIMLNLWPHRQKAWKLVWSTTSIHLTHCHMDLQKKKPRMEGWNRNNLKTEICWVLLHCLIHLSHLIKFKRKKIWEGKWRNNLYTHTHTHMGKDEEKLSYKSCLEHYMEMFSIPI